MNLWVHYRGSLASCNYACGYCPFSKRTDSREALRRDRDAVDRFADRLVEESDCRWRILFTPWGEALVRKWYRDAVTRLTRTPHVDTVAVQTNLSCRLDWVEECDADRLAFWATFHPREADADTFVRKVVRLRERGARVSVGVVGVREFFDEIASLRERLPSDVYLWVNAQQPRPRPYSDDDVAGLTSIDPHFPLTLKRERSLGRFCRTGEQAFAVDARGDMRRCHFVKEVIGNFYAADWRTSLRPRPCPNRFCDCFLGKSQLNAASSDGAFGARLGPPVPDRPTGSRAALGR